MKKKEIDESQVRPYFKGDLKGMLLACAPLSNFFTKKSIVLSMILPSILIFILSFNSVNNEILIEFVSNLSSIGSSLVGVLLGISLGGFILVVSYGNQALIDKSIKSQADRYIKKKEMKFSYIQVSIGKYGLIVLLQFIAFVLFLIFTLTVELELEVGMNLAKVTNYSSIWLLSALLFYTMYLTYQLVLNIFTLSQTSSFNQFYDHFED